MRVKEFVVVRVFLAIKKILFRNANRGSIESCGWESTVDFTLVSFQSYSTVGVSTFFCLIR